MSNIYVHEPPTNGKVLLLTSAGDVEVELWSKEAPIASRNFVQLCMEGYYDNSIFHRLVKDFIVQGGDPGGDGSSEGESIYGKPFPDEFHSRIRFVRRGLLGMANSGVANDNTSHFFFTLAPTPELNNKNTIFGRVGGDTIYNMLRMGEGEVGPGDRPLYPHKIVKTKVVLVAVLINPFDDIVPRVLKKVRTAHAPKPHSTATKNFTLLSFGEEAEEDEKEEETEKWQGKGKSSHDLLESNKVILTSEAGVVGREEKEKEGRLEAVKEKLSRRREEEKERGGSKRRKEDDEDKRKKDGWDGGKKGGKRKEEGGFDDPDYDFMKVGELKESSAKRIESFKKEAKALKRELLRGTQRDKQKDKEADKEKDKESDKEKDKEAGKQSDRKSSTRLERDLSAYEGTKHKQMSGKEREGLTMHIFNKFKTLTQNTNKLTSLLGADDDDDEEEEGREDEEEEDDDRDDSNDLSWMTDKLVFRACKEASDDVTKAKVLDANVEEKERYDISDPRNSIVARRRKKKKR